MAVLGNPIHLTMTLDTKSVQQGINDAQKQFSQLSRHIQSENNKINISMGSIVRGFASLSGINLGISGIKEFISEVIRMTGTMQGLQLSFETMLQSKSAADKMMMDVKNFALQTPYTITETAATVKQLIAMNAAGDDVMQTYKALGDVAAGLNVPLQRIAINFGQVAALGRLQAREVRDFAMAGVPIWDELAAVMGKSVNEIQSLVTAGQVGFKDVLDAFMRMSSEGGRFANMMEKMNSTVLGQINRLKDQLEQMFAAIGEANTGIIYGAISSAASLVENYKAIINTITSLATAYGIVWTAQKLWLSLDAGVQASRYNVEVAELEALIAAKRQNQNADLQTLVNDKKITVSQAQRIASLRAELTAEQDAAINRAKNAVTRIEQEKAVTAALIAENNKRIAEIGLINKKGELIISPKTGLPLANIAQNQEELNTLYIQKNTLARQSNKIAEDERRASIRLSNAEQAMATVQAGIDTAATNANTAAKNRAAIATAALGRVFKGLGAAMAASWPTAVIAAIIMGISAIVKSVREANDARKEYEKNIIDEQTQTNKLILELGRANLAEKERKDILQQLKQINPTIVEGIEDESNAYNILNQRIKEYNIAQQTRLAASFIADDVNFERMTESLAKQQAKMSQIEAKIQNDYSNLLKKIQEERDKNNISQTISEEMDTIISSEMSNIDKLRSLVNAFQRSRIENNILAGNTPEINKANLSIQSYERILSILENRVSKVNDSTQTMKERIDALISSTNGLSIATKQSLTADLYRTYRIEVEESVITVDAVAERIANLGPVSEMSISQLISNSKLAETELSKLTLEDADFSKWETLKNNIDDVFDSLIERGEDTAPIWELFKQRAEATLSNLEIGDPAFAIAEAEYNNADKNLKRFGLNAIRERERQRNEAKQAAEKTKREQEQQAREEEQLKQKINSILLDLEQEYQDSVISAMKDGAEKRQAQLLLETDREIKALQDKYAELANLQGGSLNSNIAISDTQENRADMLAGGLTKDQVNTFFSTILNIETKYWNEKNQIVKEGLDKERDDWENYLIEYGNVEEQVLATTERYARLIAEAKTKGEKLTLGKDRDREIANIRKNAIEESDIWKRLFEDVGRISTQTLRELFKQAEEELSSATDLSVEDIRRLQRRLDEVRNELARRNPFSVLKKAYEDYRNAVISGDENEIMAAWSNITVVTGEIKNQFSDIGDTLKDAFSSLGADSLAAMMDKVVSSINNAVIAFEKLGKSGSKSSGDVVQGISGIIGIITTIIGSLMTAIQKNEAGRRNFGHESLSDLLNYTKFWADNLINIRLINSGILDDIYAQIDAIENLKITTDGFMDSTNINSDALSKLNIDYNIDSDSNSYNALKNLTDQSSYLYKEALKISEAFINVGYNVGQALGFDKYNADMELQAISQQILILKQLTYELAAAQADAKKKEKEKNKYEQQILEAEKRIEELVLQGARTITEKINEILGTNVEGIADKLSSALMSAFENGTNAAEAWGKAVDEIIRDMATNAILARALEKPINDAINKVTSGWFDGTGKFIATEDQLANDLRDLDAILIGLGETGIKIAEGIANTIGLGGGTNEAEQRTSASQGFAQASQDSIDALFGVIVNIENSVWEIKESRQIVQNVMSNILSQTIAIRTNTEELNGLQDRMRGMSGQIDEMVVELRKFNR